MFIEVNGAIVNTYTMSGFKKVDEKLPQSDGTYVDVYSIMYMFPSGSTLKETFTNQSDRDDRFDALKDKLLIK